MYNFNNIVIILNENIILTYKIIVYKLMKLNLFSFKKNIYLLEIFS